MDIANTAQHRHGNLHGSSLLAVSSLKHLDRPQNGSPPGAQLARWYVYIPGQFRHARTWALPRQVGMAVHAWLRIWCYETKTTCCSMICDATSYIARFKNQHQISFRHTSASLQFFSHTCPPWSRTCTTRGIERSKTCLIDFSFWWPDVGPTLAWYIWSSAYQASSLNPNCIELETLNTSSIASQPICVQTRHVSGKLSLHIYQSLESSLCALPTQQCITYAKQCQYKYMHQVQSLAPKRTAEKLGTLISVWWCNDSRSLSMAFDFNACSPMTGQH